MAAGQHDTFHHVRDSNVIEIPDLAEYMGFWPEWLSGAIPLPEILGFQITKFMLWQVVAGVAALLVFRGLARRIQNGEPAPGRWWNFWETIAVFIRDEMVRPTIGDDHGHAHHDEEHEESAEPDFVEGGRETEVRPQPGGAAALDVGHPADRYLPFVWSCFFYILFCNLLGAIPWLGAATGNLNVTGALAFVTLATVVMYGAEHYGVSGFVKNLVPTMDLPGPIKVALVPMIWVIEVAGLFIRHAVLAVRLFANMMAGHTVIAVILGFIAVAAGGGWLYWLVLPTSILGQVAIALLELLVAFIQAYIFAFLATLFIATAVHPH